MVRGDVQRAEIVPVGFDVRTLGDGAAHGAEDRGDLLHGAADRVDQAGRARARRQGGIEPLGRRGGRRVRRLPVRRGGPRSRRSARPSAGSARRRARGAARAGSCRGRAAAPVSRPLRPSTATRTASQARRSVAAASAASVSACRADRSSVMAIDLMPSCAAHGGHPAGETGCAGLRSRACGRG